MNTKDRFCLCDTKYHLLGLYKDYKILQMR